MFLLRQCTRGEEIMTSRERLLAALRRQETDRVPISTYELCGWNSHAFENQEPSYQELMNVIREKTDCVCMWNPRSDAQAYLTSSRPIMESREERGRNYTDAFATIHTPKGPLSTVSRVYDNVRTTWVTEHLCKTPEDMDRLLSIPFEPVAYDDGDFARVRAELGDRGIIMATVSDPSDTAMLSMAFGDAMVWAMTETEHFASTLAEIHHRNMVNLENMLKTRTVDLYRVVGSETMTPPYLPPELYHRLLVPCLKEIVELIHRYDCFVRIHCHGNIRHVLDDILDSGADALDPCEGPPDGDISLAELKRRAGGQLCLFGNLQLKLLENGSTAEVREAVRRCMEDAKEGGGYVIMPTAAPISIPLSKQTEENYMAFIDAALAYGKY